MERIFIVNPTSGHGKSLEIMQYIEKKCKENNIHTAIDTAGNVPFHYFEKIMDYTDLFLYDIKCSKFYTPDKIPQEFT